MLSPPVPKVPADFLPYPGWLLPKAAQGSERAAQPFVYAVLTSRGFQLKGIPEDSSPGAWLAGTSSTLGAVSLEKEGLPLLPHLCSSAA